MLTRPKTRLRKNVTSLSLKKVIESLFSHPEFPLLNSNKLNLNQTAQIHF